MNNICNSNTPSIGMTSSDYYAYQPASGNISNNATTQIKHQTEQHNNLWNQIMSDNNSTLNSSSDSGMMTNNIRNSGSGMMTNNTRSPDNTTVSGSTTSFVPETVSNPDFLPGYLSQHIGRWVRLDSLIGNSIDQRVGILREVGASYVILQAIEPATIVVCDMYSIKYVTIVLDNNFPKLFHSLA